MGSVRPNWKLFSEQLKKTEKNRDNEDACREYLASRAELVRDGFLTLNRMNAWGFRFVRERSKGVDGHYFTNRKDAVDFGKEHFVGDEFWEATFFGDLMLEYGESRAGMAESPAGR